MPPKVREKKRHYMQNEVISKLCIFNPFGDLCVTLGIISLTEPSNLHLQNLGWI